MTKSITVAPETGPLLLTLAGVPMKVRFGLKFLKALTDRDGAAGPGDVLERLGSAPLNTLLDMAEIGIRHSKQFAELPEGTDILEAIDELPREEQKALFAALLSSVVENPIMEVLTPNKTS